MQTNSKKIEKRIAKWRAIFLDSLSKGFSITAAASRAGVARRTVYHHMEKSPAFAKQVEDAIEQGVDCLEDEAFHRAMKGSDTLLIFLLKAKRPHRYRDTSAQDAEQFKRDILVKLEEIAKDAIRKLESTTQQNAPAQRHHTDNDADRLAPRASEIH